MDAEYIRSIETRAFAAWPAAFTGNDEGWLLRANNGYTKRANSANALHPAPALLDAAQGPMHSTDVVATKEAAALESRLQAFIARTEAFYTARALATVFRLTPLAGDSMDGALERAGYRLIEPTWVMTASLHKLPSDAAESARSCSVALNDHWSAGWSNDYARLNALSGDAHAAHETILGNVHEQAVFASAVDAQTSSNLGLGMAVVNGDMVGVFDIIVDGAQRNRGIGRRLMINLLTWGREHGAKTAYLQVTAANAPAVHLYRQLGFDLAYRYHYRVKDRAAP